MSEKIPRRRPAYITKYLSVVLLFAVTAMLIGLVSRGDDVSPVSASPSGEKRAFVIVVDPGHGGEDGGASSDSGITEKDLNLKVSKLAFILLSAGGCDARLTRSDDRLVYDMYGDLGDYSGQKKTYDLRNRVRYANEAGADVFVSVHMNKFTQPQYRGLQVYYSPNDDRSQIFAENVRRTVKKLLLPDNERQIKRSTSSIYILNSLDIPAILVECGFLSNPDELADLTDPAYELSLAACVSSAIENTLAESGAAADTVP